MQNLGKVTAKLTIINLVSEIHSSSHQPPATADTPQRTLMTSTTVGSWSGGIQPVGLNPNTSTMTLSEILNGISAAARCCAMFGGSEVLLQQTQTCDISKWLLGQARRVSHCKCVTSHCVFGEVELAEWNFKWALIGYSLIFFIIVICIVLVKPFTCIGLRACKCVCVCVCCNLVVCFHNKSTYKNAFGKVQPSDLWEFFTAISLFVHNVCKAKPQFATNACTHICTHVVGGESLYNYYTFVLFVCSQKTKALKRSMTAHFSLKKSAWYGNLFKCMWEHF